MLTQGSTQPRPPRGKSQAHPGIHPLSSFTHQTQKFQPLPTPIGPPPYHYDLADHMKVVNDAIKNRGKLICHVAGDTGPIKNPDYQTAVAEAMKADLSDEKTAPNFFYHLGDVVYYNGQVEDYYDQFYEAYDHYTPPIFAIPGNHDGDPIDDTQTSLDGWVRYFMTPVPHVDPISRDAPRVTLSLPNVYYTLITPFATFIGMYTNVPEHGSIDSVQQQWLTNEFNDADPKKALIVALHHPVYSFDDHHSGSSRMADALSQSINDTRRVPNLVLTAHVHNTQRITRPITGDFATTFIVQGAGGYYHLHHLQATAGTTDADTNATLEFGDDKQHGYLTLEIDEKLISGSFTFANPGEPVTRGQDPFSISTKAVMLKLGERVDL